MITIDKIKELREITDAPVQYCKQALETSNGDIELAKEELKRLGQNSTRTALPECGAIGVLSDDHTLAYAICKCETDFVAKNEKFTNVVDLVAYNLFQGVSYDIAHQIFQENVVWFKENCNISETFLATNATNKVAYYLHHNRQRLAFVRYTGDSHEAAVKVATHIVATNPQYVSRNKMPQEELLELERTLTEIAKESGKPEKAIEMIVKGQIKKKLAESVLMEQAFYADPKITVEQYCKDNNISIEHFYNVMV